MMAGGWDFVSWAYGIAYGALALYSLTLWRRIESDAALPHPDDHPGDDAS